MSRDSNVEKKTPVPTPGRAVSYAVGRATPEQIHWRQYEFRQTDGPTSGKFIIAVKMEYFDREHDRADVDRSKQIRRAVKRPLSQCQKTVKPTASDGRPD